MCEPSCIECNEGRDPALLATGDYKAIWKCDTCGCVWMESWKEEPCESEVLIHGDKLNGTEKK